MSEPDRNSPIVTPWFGFITGGTPAVPEFYWNVYSMEQRWKFLCVNLQQLADFVNGMRTDVNDLQSRMDTVESEWESMQEGLVDAFAERIDAWLESHMREIMEKAISFCMFGINEDGRYVAYVPDNWNQIAFDFGYVYGRSDYNRIKLVFSADGHPIDNTYSYTLAQPQDVAQLLADLETTTSRGDATYDAMFTNLNEVVPDAD